jgi:DNA mismatch repair ATPase MutL
MAVQLNINYEQLLQLVDQLTEAQQSDLIDRLLEKAKTRQMSVDERKALFEALKVDLGAVSSEYSDRRADWYDDDGR